MILHWLQFKSSLDNKTCIYFPICLVKILMKDFGLQMFPIELSGPTNDGREITYISSS